MRGATCVAILLSFQLGCAAVFRGTTQQVHVESTPDAEVRTGSGTYVGKTPLDTEVDRLQPSGIALHHEGYADGWVHFTQHPSTGWFIWDIGTCAIPVLLCIPALVDAVTGAWFSLDDSYVVKLVPASGSTSTTPSEAPRPPPPQAPPSTLSTPDRL